MAGAVDVETRGAIEASEGAGGRGAWERWVRWYEGGLAEVARHRLGSEVRLAWTPAQAQRLREAVSDDRRGDGVV